MHAVGHLHSRLRHKARDLPAAALAARFARLSEASFASALEPALQGSDPGEEVVVVRELHVRLKVDIRTAEGPPPGDDAILAAWATAVARAAAAASGGGSSDSVLRFPSRAAYLAAFIRELLAGRAAQCWWCQRLARYRGADAAKTLAAVLEAHAAEAALALADPALADRVDEILTLLAEAGRARLWRRALGALAGGDGDEGAVPGAFAAAASGDVDRETLRPLADAARGVARRLGIATAKPETERLEQLAERLHGPIDWRDPRDLARVVAHAFEVLAEGLAATAVAALQRAEVEEAVAPLSWLDRRALALAITTAGMAAGTAAMPTASTRLRMLMTELAATAAAPRPGTRDPAAGALRLWVALARRGSPLAREPVALLWLDRLTRLSTAVARMPPEPSVLTALRKGDSTLLRRHVTARLPAWRGTLDHLLSAGPDAALLLVRLIEQSAPRSAATSVWSSRVAGLLLLCRTLAEARFPAVCRAASLDDQAAQTALAAALARALAGPEDRADAPPDPAIAVFAGLPLGAPLLEGTTATTPIIEVGRAVAMIATQRRAWRPSTLLARRFGEHTVLGDQHGLAWLVVPADVDPATEAARLGAALAPGDDEHAGWRAACNAFDLDLRRPPDAALGGLASLILRIFAAWLGPCAGASLPWLLTEIVRRQGRLGSGPEGLAVELEPRPYDLVLERAGYFDPCIVALGPGARLHFHRRSARWP